MLATSPISRLICAALTVAWILLLVRVVVSWLEFFGVRRPITGPLRTAYDLLFDVTEPMLRPLRKIIPPAGMFDLSVVVAFIVIFVLQSVLC
ncbi:MAG: YggT family protein [Planctomycetaceae bacterium]